MPKAKEEFSKTETKKVKSTEKRKTKSSTRMGADAADGRGTKETKKAKPAKISQAEFEKKVLALAKSGMTSEKIGESLRKEGVHSEEFDKKIAKIIQEKSPEDYKNPDLKNVEENLERIKSHLAKNKQDKRAMREKDRVFAQLRKLKKYHKVA